MALKEALEKKTLWKAKKKKTKPVKAKSSTQEEEEGEKVTAAWYKIEEEFSNRKRYGERILREMEHLTNAYIKLQRFVPTSIPFMRGMKRRKRKRRSSASSKEDIPVPGPASSSEEERSGANIPVSWHTPVSDGSPGDNNDYDDESTQSMPPSDHAEARTEVGSVFSGWLARPEAFDDESFEDPISEEDYWRGTDGGPKSGPSNEPEAEKEKEHSKSVPSSPGKRPTVPRERTGSYSEGGKRRSSRIKDRYDARESDPHVFKDRESLWRYWMTGEPMGKEGLPSSSTKKKEKSKLHTPASPSKSPEIGQLVHKS